MGSITYYMPVASAPPWCYTVAMHLIPLLALLPLCLGSLAATAPPAAQTAPPAHAVPLFAGQVTHPLSAAELAALRQKLRFAPDMPAEARGRIMQALDEALRYPAGREQARVLLASPRAEYPIALADNMGAFGSAGSEGVVLDARMLGDLQQTASTLLHELCHVQQQRACPATCARETMAYLLIQEAESKAVGWEWFLETGTPGDRMLGDFYASRLASWQAVARGEKPLPAGIPPFSPAEGAEPGAAQAAWAQQMAMYETRARIIKDFITPLPAVDSGLGSYFVLATQLLYRSNHMGLLLQEGRHPRAFREARRHDYAIPESVLTGNPLFLHRAELERACEGPIFSRSREDVTALFEQAAERLAGQQAANFTQAYRQLMGEKAPGGCISPQDVEQLVQLCRQASYYLGKGDAAGLDRAVGELRRISGNPNLPGAQQLLAPTP